ncbi:hypothetical protein [Dysgonomonas termitidis]|uniref:Uncharacterized protein n=1 Tax=Dysgonomonas termitidis TaxID=1516126 RepID=A0ABV9KYV9_9BACT
MNGLLQQIEKVFNENKLIGNHDFTEEEYSLMVDVVGSLSDDFNKNHHNLIFATLVEIAKRWKQSGTDEDSEENSGYWDYVFKILFGSDVNQQLCQKYRDVIGWLGRSCNIPVVTYGQKYYATLMMHSFAPKNSICSFFDLCYNVFKKDLDFGFTSDDEWLCEIAAEQMKNVLGGGYREDKLVSIGSSAYSIKIGLRSFVLNESLSVEFIKFIKDTFYNINKLFNREIVEENTRLERYIVDWWKNKTESEKLSDDIVHKKRVPTVSKHDIVAKYIRNENEVFLCIPSIRLDNSNNKIWLAVYVNGEQLYSEELRTKRGELVVATKTKEFKLNELLKCADAITIKIEIKENEIVIFDSEKSKTSSLNREFILFEGEKEIFSQINKPTNYFVYSKDIDALKSVPGELSTFGTNLYNIYPNAGECLVGETKQVFFIDKTKTASLGKNACLIGSVADVEWILDDISCIVYKNAVKLMIPENFNLKALELKIDNKRYKLQELNYERIELNCYQFGLKILGLISEYYPTEISLYSYEKEKELLKETIIVLSEIDIQFNNPFYYGDIGRKITINSNNETIELSWSKQDEEVICPLNDGVLVVKVPYLKWRINDDEWHNEPINKKIWYKDLLKNGDLLEIDSPKENETVSILGKVDGKSFEIAKNQSGKFEIGRAIYANENYTNISVRFSDGKNKFDLFNIATKEHFVENPLIYRNGKVCWDVENTFIGDKDNDFFLIAKANGKNEKSGRKKVGATNIQFGNFDEDFYKIIVKIKDKNVFSKEEKYDTIFEGDLVVGTLDKLRFKNKVIKLLAATCMNAKSFEWISFIPKYFIDKLELVKEEENVYYTGQLCVIDQNGETRVLNRMENENGDYDKVNPVRIELRDNFTLWLVAGYEGENDFIGGLFFDKRRKGICNIAQQNELYDEMNLYRFKEEEYV